MVTVCKRNARSSSLGTQQVDMNNKILETRQGSLWRGELGNTYTENNEITPEFLSASIELWRRILKRLASVPPSRILEIGANLGMNLQALRQLTSAELFAVEPNSLARASLLKNEVVPAKNVKDLKRILMIGSSHSNKSLMQSLEIFAPHGIQFSHTLNFLIVLKVTSNSFSTFLRKSDHLD